MNIDQSRRLLSEIKDGDEKYPDIKKINNNDTQHVKLNIYEAEAESRLENNIKSCCGNVYDKRVIFIFTKIGISFIALLFSIYGLLIVDSCEAKNMYSGILTFIFGHWLNTGY